METVSGHRAQALKTWFSKSLWTWSKEYRERDCAIVTIFISQQMLNLRPVVMMTLCPRAGCYQVCYDWITLITWPEHCPPIGCWLADHRIVATFLHAQPRLPLPGARLPHSARVPLCLIPGHSTHRVHANVKLLPQYVDTVLDFIFNPIFRQT